MESKGKEEERKRAWKKDGSIVGRQNDLETGLE